MWLIKNKLRIVGTFLGSALLFWILIRYIKWGIYYAHTYYPSFDESGFLAIVGNYARYGLYEVPFSFYSVPKLFNPFTSIGPTVILPAVLIVKLSGFHYYIVHTFIFLFISIPLVISIALIVSILQKKSSVFRKIMLVLVTTIVLLSNRLFYASPPTGGSFTHGLVGESAALLHIMISLISLFFGFKKKNLILFALAGVFASLAYITKTISLLYIISLIISYLIYVIFVKTDNLKIKIQSLIALIAGCIAVYYIFFVWTQWHLRGTDSSVYECWNKIVYLEKGSGFKTFFNPSWKVFSEKAVIATNTLVDFFSIKMDPYWGEHKREKMNLIFISLSVLLIGYFLLFFTRLKKIILTKDSEELPRYMVLLTLIFTFLSGSIWYFFISDFSWIRHYYIFFFTGLISLLIVISWYTPKQVIIPIIFLFLIYELFFYMPRTPFFHMYNLAEIPFGQSEKGDQQFINFFKTQKNRKTYVCSIFTLTNITFLSGDRFYNNILTEKNNVYNSCNKLPDAKLRTINDKEFNYIYLSDSFNPECSKFIKNQNLELIYDYGYKVFKK